MTDTPHAPLSPEERSRLQRLAATAHSDRFLSNRIAAEQALAAACSPTVVLSLLVERDALARDAERYRFLRPHLDTDGDVDDADMACRFYAWIRIREEIIHVPDAIGYSSVDAAIDAALAARSGATPTGGETR